MKKRTQKLLALATVFTMGAAMLASCGKKAASGDAAGETKAESAEKDPMIRRRKERRPFLLLSGMRSRD